VQNSGDRRDSGPELRVGRGPRADISFPQGRIRRDHARIVLDPEGPRLRAVGPVRVHGHPIREVRLRDGDLVQLGRRLLVRVRLPGPDGEPIALEEAGRPAPAHGSHVSLARVLVATLAFATVIGTAAIVVQVTRPPDNDVEAALAQERSQRSSTIAQERRRNEDRIEDIRVEVARRLGDVTRSLSRMDEGVDARIERAVAESPRLLAAQDAIGRLAREQRAAESVIERASPAVCVVQGAYGFGRVIDGEWRFLRELAADTDTETSAADHDADLPLSLEGKGKIFTVEYTGTGFLAHARGIVLTNRHIAEPWWKNEAATPIIESDFEPRFVYLRAFFPGRREAVAFDTARTCLADKADLAALVFEPGGDPLPQPLPLAEAGALPRGRRIVMLGYPSGLSALLARDNEDDSLRLSTSDDFDARVVLDTLAARGLVRPLPSQGHIDDQLRDKLLFNAPSQVGGSGAPVLDLEGRVIAVNYGILKAFNGTNFGVPARLAKPLIERALAR